MEAIAFRPRRAVPADLDVLTQFQLAMARDSESLELDRDALTRGIARVLEDRALGDYYVIDEGARAIGCTLVTREWSDWRNAFWWWIQSVYVVPERRRGGAFRVMYQHLKQLASGENDVCGLRLYVDRGNVRAQEVYARLGMNGEHYRVFEWVKPRGA